MTCKLVIPVFLSCFLCLTGCVPHEKPGSVSLQVDLRNAAVDQTKDGATITRLVLELTRDGYSPIRTSLAVGDNLATGTVTNLAAGKWHVKVGAYAGPDQLFSRETDVNVVAGAMAEAQLLFDAAKPEPTTGSLRITAGLNPLPGYKVMNQSVDGILFSAIPRRLYALDASTQSIVVYDSGTMEPIHSIKLPQAPLSIALSYREDAIFLGQTTGQIYLLDLATETPRLVGDALTQVREIVALTEPYVLIAGPGEFGVVYKTINFMTGQIISIQKSSNHSHGLGLNPVQHVVYGQANGGGMVRVPVDRSTGIVGKVDDSRYMGGNNLGSPLRFVNSYSRVCTSSGEMFTCASPAENDLTYAGNLGQRYVDLFSDDAWGCIYQLLDAELQKLLIIDQRTYSVVLSVDLPAKPARVFADGLGIVVLTQQDGRYYSKVLTKASLGLKARESDNARRLKHPWRSS